MSLFDNGFYNPNDHLLQVAGQSNARAVLFLFSPMQRSFADQAHRPVTYLMNDDAWHLAREVAHRANIGGQPRALVDGAVYRPDMLGAVMPAESPTAIIGLSHLSGNWKFMLVINGGTAPQNQASIWNRNNQGREIYFGYCIDEPINPMTLGMSEPTVNNDAKLVITHKSFIQVLPTIGATAQVPRVQTMFDVDIVPPDSLRNIVSGPMQLNDPLNLCRNAEITTAEGLSFAIPQPIAANDLAMQPRPIPIDSMMHNPQDNLASLMHAAILGNAKLTSDKALNRDSPFDGNHTRGDVLSESMENYFQSGTAAVRSGLNPETLYTLGMIRQQYAPDVVPIGFDRTTMFSPYDQSTRSANAVFASLLCSAIPPLLMQAQILHFAFQYQTRNYQNNHPDNWAIHSVQTAIPMDGATQQYKVQAVMHLLMQGLFRMMKETRGDFEVAGTFGVANVSHCYINFYCDNNQMVDPYEVPTIFGGMTSTLIADHNTTMHNTQQYSKLLTAMVASEVNESIPEMYNNAPVFQLSHQPSNGPRYDQSPSLPASGISVPNLSPDLFKF